MSINTVIVFVHGWSVTSTDTYGGLPGQLKWWIFPQPQREWTLWSEW